MNGRSFLPTVPAVPGRTILPTCLRNGRRLRSKNAEADAKRWDGRFGRNATGKLVQNNVSSWCDRIWLVVVKRKIISLSFISLFDIISNIIMSNTMYSK